MKKQAFVDFVLLHGYSLDNYSLMYGKMGCALSLFEYSRKFHYKLGEKHAYDFLQEALAFPLAKNTFDGGKMGIAWALIYLIDNQFIEAEYLELYGQEHGEILAFIEQMRNETLNVVSKVDAISFLEISKLYISKYDFNKNLSILTESLHNYFKIIPNNIFECEVFYNIGNKILGYCHCYKELYFDAEELINAIVKTHMKLINNGYVCNNLSFGVGLLQYGIYCQSEYIVGISNVIINCCISNINLGTVNLKALIDSIYNLNKLYILNQETEYFQQKEELSKLLFNTSSYLYETGYPALNTLKDGIPRLLFMECLKDKSIDSYGHLIMLE